VEEQYGAIKPTILRLKLKGSWNFYDKQESLPIDTVIEMTEQVPDTKNTLLL
jgi:hypothetical protein